MHVVFLDDTRQGSPTRPGMRAFVGSGAVLVPGDNVVSLDAAIDEVCRRAGLPAGEELKWSPRRDSWMRHNCVDTARVDLFTAVLRAAEEAGVLVLVVLEDESSNPAITASQNAETDVVHLLLERVELRLDDLDSTAILIADRPGGGSAEAGRFVTETLEHTAKGTDYVNHERLGLVLTADSRTCRLLQLADLVTACTAARFAGDHPTTEAVFPAVLQLAPESYGRRGGTSIKMHPDFRYLNLYHWLLGDDDWVHFQNARPFPHPGRPYSRGAGEP